MGIGDFEAFRMIAKSVVFATRDDVTGRTMLIETEAVFTDRGLWGPFDDPRLQFVWVDGPKLLRVLPGADLWFYLTGPGWGEE